MIGPTSGSRKSKCFLPCICIIFIHFWFPSLCYLCLIDLCVTGSQEVEYFLGYLPVEVITVRNEQAQNWSLDTLSSSYHLHPFINHLKTSWMWHIDLYSSFPHLQLGPANSWSLLHMCKTVPDSNFAKAALTSMAAPSREFLDVVKCGEIKMMNSGCAEGVGTC